jgi:hypothetical protein
MTKMVLFMSEALVCVRVCVWGGGGDLVPSFPAFCAACMPSP